MKTRRSVVSAVMGAAVLVAAGLVTSSCSLVKTTCVGGIYDIVPEAEGKPTPLLAAEQWAIDSTLTLPPLSGWRKVSSDASGVTLKTDSGATVHVVQLPNGNWIVDEGKYCH